MKKRFKILFIDVIDHSIKFQDSYPHLGIGYLISYLQREMDDIDILVVNSKEMKHLESFKPNVVAISSATQNYNKAKRIAKDIKDYNPACPIIIGGVHVSQLPGSIDTNMDIAVIGEGEETFSHLIKHMRDNNNFLKNLENIDGLSFWNDNQLINTQKRDVISPLDKIPHPARSKLPNSDNHILLTSRGCPYKCAFCASSHFWRNVRYFSTDYVMEEIDQILSSYPILTLFIFDDLFVFNKKRLEEISLRIVKEGYHKKVNFWCTARANHIDEESVKYLKKMNMKGVGLGLESGSDKILKMVKSDSVSVEVNKKAINLCKKNGIFVHGSFMLGCPYETESDMLKTYDFVKNSGIDKGDITVATPLPGTKFWEYALKEVIVSTNMDWSRLAYRYTDDMPTMENSLLLSKEVSKQRFLEIFKDIIPILLSKRKEYEKKWERVQGKELSFNKIFSFITLKKFIKDPLRGMRYAVSFLLNIPNRLLSFPRHLYNKYK